MEMTLDNLGSAMITTKEMENKRTHTQTENNDDARMASSKKWDTRENSRIQYAVDWWSLMPVYDTGMVKQRIPISSMQYPLNSTIILNFSKVTTNEVISFQANNQSSEYKI